MNDIEPESSKEKTSAWIRLAEVSQILEWMHKRAWPLGGGITSIAVLCLYYYIQAEQVPINITSPSVLAGYLPVIIVMMIFSLVFFTLLLLGPSVILLTPINSSGDKLIDTWVKSEKGGEGAKDRVRVLVLWSAVITIHATFIFLLYFVLDLISDYQIIHGVLFFTIQFFPVVAGVLYLFFVHKKELNRKSKLKETSSHFWFGLLMWGTVQFIAVIVIALLIIKNNGGINWLSILLIFISLLVLAFFQLLSADIVMRVKSSQQPVTISGLIGVFIMICVAVIPDTGSMLAGHVLQTVASGGKKCVVFTWLPDTKVIEAVKDSSVPSQSRPLKIHAFEEGQYMVRLVGENSTDLYFISRSLIAGIKEYPCRQ